MGHPKEAQEQGQWGNLFRNSHTADQCLSGGRMESPLLWQFKIPQAEQQTFGDALPAGPALHSRSIGATKSSFMENQINKDFPHLYWHYINFKPSFSRETSPQENPFALTMFFPGLGCHWTPQGWWGYKAQTLFPPSHLGQTTLTIKWI